MIRFIDPLNRLGSRLLEVEKPARYTGGEYGALAGKEAALRAAVVFPDLYELGMSNQAFRIIYNGLNRIPGISCDRAFAPAPDFEGLLEEEGIPLYGLDTGIALADTDLLLFSLGYELGMGGVLSVLDHAQIPLHARDRRPRDPVVIMGGPCVSNPLPYSLFIDAFWIGEAEAGFFELCGKLLELKRAGAPRRELLALTSSHPHVWVPGKPGVVRAVWNGFGRTRAEAAVFPLPNIKIVQHHGAVEIMRGCPNGCRFCHAGFWYRPMRQKPAAAIIREAEECIRLGGWREVSLSSLSSGDYCGVDDLVSTLNRRWGEEHVSFQLPSLKVSGFSLSLLSKISEVRKSGLTFAVETPGDMEQLSLNKRAALDETVSIIRTAKQSGWRGVKFYFMVGLPLTAPGLSPDQAGPPGMLEEEKIVSFIMEAAERTSSRFHINAGTFVPKPHTPYQRAAQLDEEGAWKKLHHIQDALKSRGHKVGVHNPFVSLLEGIIARGDERVGPVLEKAYRRGCRLDAWSEHINTGVWRDLAGEEALLVRELTGARAAGEGLPWSVIESGVGEAYLIQEAEYSEKSKLTSPCMKKCTHPCGVCGGGAGIVQNIIQNEVEDPAVERAAPAPEKPAGGAPVSAGQTFRMLFSFFKRETAVFVSHLGVIEVFAASARRAGIRGSYTQGFNPLLRLDFASPAALGLGCEADIAAMDLEVPLDPEDFIRLMNGALPPGFGINAAELFTVPLGRKKYSPASLLWGFRYADSLVPAKEEKNWRIKKAAGNLFGLTRRAVLASEKDAPPEDYFSIFRRFYKTPGPG
ncbi:MAG: TIGR03936 family radical SAM-associated protein [Treponema sp.]|jgi:radical SAM superfamily enzyme YgiQ (UPF0313 family)|nr:TIGR03936 family radical SAM-associated protein [Treponema sp.]